MTLKIYILFLIVTFVLCAENLNNVFKTPTIVVAILVRNKAHTLPYFLTFLEKLDYPKNRMTLWIHSDNNVDNSIEILRTWLRPIEQNYHNIEIYLDKKSSGLSDEISSFHWSPKRFSHIMNLREEALNFARKNWADYIFMLDADVFLTNPQTLKDLMSHELTVVAPLLKSDSLYSNFWAGMTDDYYYMRTDRYKPILNREEEGCLSVPMIHSAVFIDLRRVASDFLTYQSKNIPNYNGPEDDIISFAVVANKSGIPLHICNDYSYGYITVPLDAKDTIETDKQQLINVKMEMLSEMIDIPILERLQTFIQYPRKDTLGLSHIFMINLIRRSERRTRMLRCFDELGLDVEIIDAVDGRSIDDNFLNEKNIKIMPNYSDPYHKRPMTMGEIGCFLSHFIIWNKVIENNYETVMILEDDVKFETYFRQRLSVILQELKHLNIDWDLIYLGRKRMQEGESWVEGSKFLVHPGYSYWTVGYLLSASGAEKLLRAKPLEKLIPVDEYFPILFDKHPRIEWKEFFPERNLIALSTAPFLIYPTHYTGESGYVSDTENSTIITEQVAADSHINRDEL